MNDRERWDAAVELFGLMAEGAKFLQPMTGESPQIWEVTGVEYTGAERLLSAKLTGRCHSSIPWSLNDFVRLKCVTCPPPEPEPSDAEKLFNRLTVGYKLHMKDGNSVVRVYEVADINDGLGEGKRLVEFVYRATGSNLRTRLYQDGFYERVILPEYPVKEPELSDAGKLWYSIKMDEVVWLINPLKQVLVHLPYRVTSIRIDDDDFRRAIDAKSLWSTDHEILLKPSDFIDRLATSSRPSTALEREMEEEIASLKGEVIRRNAIPCTHALQGLLTQANERSGNLEREIAGLKNDLTVASLFGKKCEGRDKEIEELKENLRMCRMSHKDDASAVMQADERVAELETKLARSVLFLRRVESAYNHLQNGSNRAYVEWALGEALELRDQN